jgi:hypothetical protein
MWQIVIARCTEDLSWTRRLDKKFDVITYNKGNDDHVGIKLKNIGRETDTYLHHIIQNYDNLSEHTIFTQGEPFQHAPDFLEKIHNIEGSFMPLSIQYCTGEPPLNFLQEDGLYDIDMCNDVEWYIRHPIIQWNPIDVDYRKYKQIPPDENGFYTFAKEIGVPFDKNTKKIKFFYSGIFYIHRDVILQYPKEMYEKWLLLNQKHYAYGYLFEKMWHYIFVIAPRISETAQ